MQTLMVMEVRSALPVANLPRKSVHPLAHSLQKWQLDKAEQLLSAREAKTVVYGCDTRCYILDAQSPIRQSSTQMRRLRKGRNRDLDSEKECGE